MKELLYNSYYKYNSLTLGDIEQLRTRHRLRTVQTLEDSLDRNVIRSIIVDGYFKQEELQVNFRCGIEVASAILNF